MVNAADDKAINDHRSCRPVAQFVSTSSIAAFPEHTETVKDAIDYSEHPVISHPTIAVTGSRVVDVDDHVDPVISHPGAAVISRTVVDVPVDAVVSTQHYSCGPFPMKYHQLRYHSSGIVHVIDIAEPNY